MSNPTARTASIRYQKRGDSAWLQLSRPEKMNSLDPDALGGIAAGLDQSLEDGSRTVVLTGSGGTFCTGADLSFVLSNLDQNSVVEELLATASALTRRIEEHPLPVIAAVNGPAIAGGLELVLACDLVVAARSATLADGHAKFGVFPGAGATVRLPRLLGANRARHLMFTGAALSAEDMLARGVVNEVVADEDLETAVEALCGQIARTNAPVLTRMKRAIRESLDLPVDEGLRLELDLAREHLCSPEIVVGLRAFAARRKNA